MATFPVLPRWAETAAGGLAANVTTPSSGQLDTGWTLDQPPPSANQNWWQQLVYNWIQLFQKAFPFTMLGLSQIFSPLTAMAPLAQLNQGGGAAGQTNCLAANFFGTNGPVMVAGGNAGTNDAKIYATSDGVTWNTGNPHNLAGGDVVGAIAWVPFLSKFVCVGSNSTAHISTSPDGITWTAQVGAGAGTGFGSIAVSSSVVVICGSNGTTVQWSTNGTAWTSVTPGTISNRGVVWMGSAATPVFLLTGSGGTTANAIYTSPDGNTWTARTSPSANLNSPGYGDFANSRFWPNTGTTGAANNNPSVVIISENTSGKLWSSPDGISYTLIMAGNPVPGGSITTYPFWFWTGSVLIGCSSASVSPGVIESTDGVTFVWHPITTNTPSNITQPQGACMLGGSLFLGVTSTTSTLIYKGPCLPTDFATYN
jgi:hypothetical protein